MRFRLLVRQDTERDRIVMLESCNKQKEGTDRARTVQHTELLQPRWPEAAGAAPFAARRLQVQLRLQPRGEGQRLGGKPQRNSAVIINERNLEYMRCSAESGRAAQRMAE